MKYILLCMLVCLHIEYTHGMTTNIKEEQSLFFFRLSPLKDLSDESKIIFDANITTSSLIESAFFINQCHQLSQGFNLFLRKNTLTLIKKLSFLFKQSNEQIARRLQTKKSKSILLKQLGFAQRCEKYEITFLAHHLKLINPSNTDLNFTYGNLQQTQLMNACRINHFDCSNKKFVECLLRQKSTDINITNASGEPAALQAIYTDFCWDDRILNTDLLITKFINHPAFNINQIYELQSVPKAKKTTLLLTILAQREFDKPINELTENQQHSRRHKLKLVQLLCNNKADPTLTVDETSALKKAYEINHPDLIDIFHKAIKTSI